MRNRQRKLALEAWREIFDRHVSWADAEGQYHELLSVADMMEKEGLINDDEWRKLARKAGARFVDATTS